MKSEGFPGLLSINQSNIPTIAQTSNPVAPIDFSGIELKLSAQIPLKNQSEGVRTRHVVSGLSPEASRATKPQRRRTRAASSLSASISFRRNS